MLRFYKQLTLLKTRWQNFFSDFLPLSKNGSETIRKCNNPVANIPISKAGGRAFGQYTHKKGLQPMLKSQAQNVAALKPEFNCLSYNDKVCISSAS